MQDRQRGMTLLEILAAIAVGSALLIGLTNMVDVSLEDAKGQHAAHHQSQVVSAAKKYIAANYTTLIDDTASGVVVGVSIPSLATFLPAGFADQNSYQQNTCLLVRQDAGKLNALITTYNGTPIPDRNIAAVAMGAGQGAGYINSVDTTTARGPSWSLLTTPFRSGTCAGGTRPLTGGATDAGHLVSSVFYDGPGQLSTDFLYRDSVPGRPDLNRLNVPLQLAGSALVGVGDACTHTALALDSTTKNLVVCDGGAWRYASSWGEPVASYSALATLPSNDGDVRITRDTGRAFVYNAAAGNWTALALDQNGDFRVSRDLLVGRNFAGEGTLYARGAISTDADINVAGNADIGQTLTAQGNIDAKGDVTVAGSLVTSGLEAEWIETGVVSVTEEFDPGDACHLISYEDGAPVILYQRGTMVRDSSGIPLICAIDNTFRYANGKYTR